MCMCISTHMCTNCCYMLLVCATGQNTAVSTRLLLCKTHGSTVRCRSQNNHVVNSAIKVQSTGLNCCTACYSGDEQKTSIRVPHTAICGVQRGFDCVQASTQLEHNAHCCITVGHVHMCHCAVCRVITVALLAVCCESTVRQVRSAQELKRRGFPHNIPHINQDPDTCRSGHTIAHVPVHT